MPTFSTRRSFLRSVAVAGTALAGGGLLAACSSPAPAAPAAPTQAPAPTTPPAAPAAAPTTAPAVAAGSGSEVLIGAIYPLSGPVAVDGTSMKNGVEMAFNEINAAGGIKSLGGAKVKLLVSDSQGKPETGQSEAEKLIQSGIVGLVGAWQSAVTLVTTQVTERARVPQVIELSVADNIMSRGFKYSFRITYGSTLGVQKNLEYIQSIAQKAGQSVKTAVYLHENSAYGSTLADTWAQLAPAKGIQLLDKISYDSNTPDLTNEVARAKSTRADVLISSGYRPDSILLARTLQQLRADFLGVFGCQSAAIYHPTFGPEAGPSANYLLDTNQGVSHRKPEGIAFLQSYQQKYNEIASLGSAYAYTAAQVLADAIERAASTDRDKVREALSRTDFNKAILPQDSIKFDETGQNVGAVPVVYQWLKDEDRVVWPESDSDATAAFPVPKWSERG